MREIPTLQVLCLRAVGSHACSAEATFAGSKDATPSSASRLLRCLARRPVGDDHNSSENAELDTIPMIRTPCIGKGSARRMQPNEVDINHPMIACRSSDGHLIMQYGNPALDCLQSYIDSLVELGRMDDNRLGAHFFREWKTNIISSRKRGRDTDGTAQKLGSLSLHNCVFGEQTVEALLESGLCMHLAVLDLTGVHGLIDDLTARLLPACKNLRRLSLKNCRRITSKTLVALSQIQSSQLQCLDLGGSFNINTSNIIDALPSFPRLTELHASGLGWTDATVSCIMDRPWQALSLGFSLYFTQPALRENLIQTAATLQSLALPFCESVVDNALLGMMGRNLPRLKYLDIRGNPGVNTMTGWFDGRVSADLPSQPLTVLGRYTSLTEKSLEETKRIHPLETTELVVILDGTGTGVGVMRSCEC